MTIIDFSKYAIQEKSTEPFYKKKYPYVILASVLIFITLVFFFLIKPLLHLKREYDAINVTLHVIEAGRKNKDFVGISSDLGSISSNISLMKRSVGTLAYIGYIPYVNGYYKNLNNAINFASWSVLGLEKMTPSMLKVLPLLGYKVSASGVAQTTSGSQKITAVVNALPEIGLSIKNADSDFVRANSYLQKINPKYIPKSLLKGKNINIVGIKNDVSSVISALPNFYNDIPAVEDILGVPNEKNYLLIMQNSGEMRPTGGFMTAYGFLTVQDGNIGHVNSQNIYVLSKLTNYHVLAPLPLREYNNATYWEIQDANTSPDVPSSVSNIYNFYDTVYGAPNVDGVIFLNTWFVDSLINDVGGIKMSSIYGNNLVLTNKNIYCYENKDYMSDANCWMEYMSEKSTLPQSERKAFISDMMHELLQKVLSSSGSDLEKVITSIFQSLNDKNILLYFNNTQDENFISKYNWGGIVPKNTNGDYLQVVEANLAGAKDNYFMSETTTSNIQKDGNNYIQTTSITWTNPALYEDWLVGPYMAWVRVYVPMGSKLISITGKDVNGYVEDYNNTILNKTVFGDHIRILPRLSSSDPPASGTMTFKYILPSDININQYLIQKQPGELPESESVTFENNPTETFVLNSDKTLNL